MKRAVKRGTKPSRRCRDAPIELYYWPTPNGWKISIMLEECALPYIVHTTIDVLLKGEQFSQHSLAISPNNRIPAIVRSNGPGGRTIAVFKKKKKNMRLKTGKILSARKSAPAS